MKSIFFNSFWFIFDKVIKLIFGFTVSVIVVRYLGPEWFGKYNYVNSIIVLFGVLISFGSEGILVKLLVSDEKSRTEILSASFWLHISLGIFAVLVSFVTLKIVRDEVNLLEIFVVLSIPSLFRGFSIVRYVYEAELQIKKVVIIENLTFLIVSALRIILIYFNFSVKVLFLTFALEGILSYLSLYIFYRSSNPSFILIKPKIEFIKKILRDSFPIFLSGFAIIVYMKVDQIMIGSLLGDTQLGVYSVGVRLSEFWYFIPIGLSSSFFPHLIQLKNDSSLDLYRNRFLLLHGILFWMAFFGALIIQFSADFIISFLYGQSFYFASSVLKIHIWSAIFVFLGVAGSNFYILENLQKYTILKSLFGLITNVVLNYMWIPDFGIIGAAYATLVSQFFANSLFLIFFKKLHPLLYLQFQSLTKIRLTNLIPILKTQLKMIK